jgi:hypothetical protein
MLTQYNTTFAKLLATENIDVQFGDFKTPFFDVKNRVLGIPSWTWSVPTSQPLWYLEVGHEVGHAKYTPFEEWEATLKEIENTPAGEIVITKDLVNIIEDVRIERLMKKRFPGLEKYFGTGYKRMLEEDVDYFGLKGKTSFTLKDASFLDRINLKAKCGDLLDVEFTDEEQAFFDAAFETKTFADVISLSYEIAEFIRNKKQEAQLEASGNVTNPEDQSGENVEDGSSTEEQADGDEESTKPTGEGDDEGEGDEESTKPTSYGHYGDLSDATDEITSKTQQAYERNRSEAVEKNEYGEVKLTGKPMTEAQRNEIIKPLNVPDVGFVSKKQYKEFVQRNKSVINNMVREFEIRKKAAQYRNAKVVRTGTLDLKKLHEYRYNDEIFVRGMKVPGGKSHGMVMLIDFSGSMYDVIHRVIKQTLQLALFCRKANIPFVVYGFTCGKKRYASKWERGSIDGNNTVVTELLNSDLSKEDFAACGAGLLRGGFSLGGTPMNESLIALQPIVKKLKETKKLQRMNLVILSDGAANKMGVVGSNVNPYSDTQSIMLDKRTKLTIPAYNWDQEITGDSEETKDILDWYRATGAADSIIHYFLMDKSACINAGIRNKTTSEPTIHTNKGGYDVKFMIPVKSKVLSSQTEALEIEDDAKKGAVIRAFKKHAGSKRKNRVIVQKFAEIIS